MTRTWPLSWPLGPSCPKTFAPASWRSWRPRDGEWSATFRNRILIGESDVAPLARLCLRAHYVAPTCQMYAVASSLGLTSRGIAPSCRRQDEFRTARRTEPDSHFLGSPEVNGFRINPTGVWRALKRHPEFLTRCDDAVGEDQGPPGADVNKLCPRDSLSSPVNDLYVSLVHHWHMSSRRSAIIQDRHGSSSLRLCRRLIKKFRHHAQR